MMVRALILVVAATGFLAVGWGLIRGRRIWLQSERAAVRSAIASIHSELEEQSFRYEKFFTDESEKWKQLGPGQCDELTADIESIDAAWEREKDGALRDKWGSRFEVFYREQDGELDFLVFSRGPDERLGTEDDICSESGRGSEMGRIRVDEFTED